jgi:hypothetical protein
MSVNIWKSIEEIKCIETILVSPKCIPMCNRAINHENGVTPAANKGRQLLRQYCKAYSLIVILQASSPILLRRGFELTNVIQNEVYADPSQTVGENNDEKASSIHFTAGLYSK